MLKLNDFEEYMREKAFVWEEKHVILANRDPDPSTEEGVRRKEAELQCICCFECLNYIREFKEMHNATA